jgi:hypothetical protein
LRIRTTRLFPIVLAGAILGRLRRPPTAAAAPILRKSLLVMMVFIE